MYFLFLFSFFIPFSCFGVMVVLMQGHRALMRAHSACLRTGNEQVFFKCTLTLDSTHKSFFT
jgi:hypothetical protein